jgi:hypothetical protein
MTADTKREDAATPKPWETLAKIEDLIKQATTERSHYYTASVLKESHGQIERLAKALEEAKAIIAEFAAYVLDNNGELQIINDPSEADFVRAHNFIASHKGEAKP